MCLIQDKDIEMFSYHEFPDRHTVSHEGYFGFRGAFFFKSYIVANLFAECNTHFICNSFSKSDRTDSSGLRNEHPGVVVKQILGNLCGLFTSGFAAYNSDFIVLDGLNNLSCVLENGQTLLNVLDLLGVLLLLSNH